MTDWMALGRSDVQIGFPQSGLPRVEYSPLLTFFLTKTTLLDDDLFAGVL
jgi:hypothetical protein